MMLRKIFVASFGPVLVLGVSMPKYVVHSVSDKPPPMCGFKPNEADFALVRSLAMEEAEQDIFAKESARHGVTPDDWHLQVNGLVKVKTHFHVLAASEETKDWVSNETLSLQLGVLNRDYHNAGFVFNLASLTRTVNSTMVDDVAMADIDGFRRALHTGNWTELNIYFVPHFPIFGMCSLPVSETDVEAQRLPDDGCVIRWDTLPGGSLSNYNLGKTAVHEVGHWLGLFHTFEGGCRGPGDFVDDTPAQSNATGGCPLRRDSCPEHSGMDPIHNYMDYSYDWCYSEFTDGQIRRMHSVWDKFRSPWVG